MAPLIRRLHLFEINDQPWFPDFLRQRVQACLTLLWTFRIPVLQPCSPASLVAQTLLRLLGEQSSRYTYVDFCSGAGGPTLAIEREFNARLLERSQPSVELESDNRHTNGEQQVSLNPRSDETGTNGGLAQRRSKRIEAKATNGTLAQNQSSPQPKEAEQALFVLTDIAPHLTAWQSAAQQSSRIRYVPQSIDASAASPSLLKSVAPIPLPASSSSLPIFRLFSLAFHHFDDPLAEKILSNTMDTSAGFAILELQGRNVSSQIMTILLFPLLVVISLFFFWRDPIHLIFTFLLPVVPFVVAVDGMVSSLRTRTGEEVRAMVQKVSREKGQDIDDWEVIWGSEWHTWPIGEMSWIVGLKHGEHAK